MYVNIMMMIVWCQFVAIHGMRRPWCACVFIDHGCR